ANAQNEGRLFRGMNKPPGGEGVHLRREIRVDDTAGAAQSPPAPRGDPGLMDKLPKLAVGPKDSSELQVSAAEFILEGLYAHKRIGRSEERVFTAGEKQPKRPEAGFGREEPPARPRRPFN